MLLNQEKREDPRTVRTRRALQQAFVDLMHEKGFHDITVGDVTERAMVNRATFYAHFEDKYALLEGSIREMFNQKLWSAMPRNAEFSAENMRKLIVAVCEFVAQLRGQCTPSKREFEPIAEQEVKAQVYVVLLDWLRVIGQRGSIPPELAAGVSSWAIYGAAYQWAGQQPRPSSEEFARQVLPMIVGSLSEAEALPA